MTITYRATCLLVALLCARVAARGADDGPAASDKPAAALELDDAPEAFVPERGPTEAERERKEAEALFAAGRLKEDRDELAEALRFYHKALRHAPGNLPIMRQVVHVASELHRNEETFLYAVKVAEREPPNIGFLLQLAPELDRQRNYVQASELYEKAIVWMQDKESAEYIRLLLEAGGTFYRNDEAAQAAEAFAPVMTALEQPEKYHVDDRLRKQIVGRLQLIGDAFLAAERFADAQAAFDKADQENPAPGVHAYNLARVFDGRKQPDDALVQLQAFLASGDDSQDTAPYDLLSRVLEELKREAELVPMLETSLTNWPKNAPLRLFLAGKYRQSGQLEKAEEQYKMVASLSAMPAEAYQGLTAIYHQTKQIEPLLKTIGDATALAQKLLEQRQLGGELLSRMWRAVLGDEISEVAADGETFAALVDAAHKKHQADADSLGFADRLGLALLALQAKNVPAADEFFSWALKSNRAEASLLYAAWGLGLASEEQAAAAVRVFQAALAELKSQDDQLEFQNLLSLALELDDRPDDALAAAKTALSLGMSRPIETRVKLESRLPWLLYRAKRYDDANQAYDELVKRYDDGDDQSEPVRQHLQRARLVLSNICVARNDLPQAEEWLEQVLDEFPGDVSAMNDLGYLWADQGKHLERALEMVEKAVEAEPDNAAYRDSLAWALHKLGRHDEALAEMKKACAGDDPDGELLDHLGDCYLAVGQEAEARSAWQRAVGALEKKAEPEKLQRVKEKLAAHPEP